jgi:hypothetical protein
MTDDVTVPFDDKTSDNAVLLLAAAEELGLDAGVVKTSEGAFVVPQEVHDKAFGKEEKKAPAKKTATKKTAAKKK